MSKHRDLLLAVGALLAVVAVVALVIGYAGMRELQYASHAFDGKRVDDLRAIAVAKRGANTRQTLADLPPAPVVNLKDPVTNCAPPSPSPAQKITLPLRTAKPLGSTDPPKSRSARSTI